MKTKTLITTTALSLLLGVPALAGNFRAVWMDIARHNEQQLYNETKEFCDNVYTDANMTEKNPDCVVSSYRNRVIQLELKVMELEQELSMYKY